ncbi:hypothetical protein B0H14DRAFT_2765871 [Mycena olivaceomarginata]|nr:hypothetical protein B0H14DRAFT_2765871 [Mycena olivaceomarginata]
MPSFFMNDWIYQTPHCISALSPHSALYLVPTLVTPGKALDGQSVQVADRTWTHQSDMARYNSGHEVCLLKWAPLRHLLIMLSVPLQLFPTMSGSNAFRFVTVFGAAPLSGVGAALDMFAAFTGCFACIPLRLPCDAPLPEEEARVFCDNCGLGSWPRILRCRLCRCVVLLLLLRCIIYLTTPHLILEPLSGSISGIARVPAITARPAKSLDGSKVLTVEVQRPEESGCRVYLWCSGAEAAKSGNFFRRHLILELAASDPCKWSAILPSSPTIGRAFTKSHNTALIIFPFCGRIHKIISFWRCADDSEVGFPSHVLSGCSQLTGMYIVRYIFTPVSSTLVFGVKGCARYTFVNPHAFGVKKALPKNTTLGV